MKDISGLVLFLLEKKKSRNKNVRGSRIQYYADKRTFGRLAPLRLTGRSREAFSIFAGLDHAWSV